MTELTEHSASDTDAFIHTLDEYLTAKLGYLGVIPTRGTLDERGKKLETAKNHLRSYIQPLLCYAEEVTNANTHTNSSSSNIIK